MKNAKEFKKILQGVFPELELSVVGLDGECPYDESQIIVSESFSILLGGNIFGRVLCWVDGGKGWLLEWNYWVPSSPVESATWLAYFCENDFELFLFNIENYFRPFVEFSAIAGVRSSIYDKTHFLYQMRSLWLEKGFELASE